MIDSNNIIRPFVFDESNEREPLFVAHLGCSECMRWNRMYGENIAENNEPETDSEDETDYESETSDSELGQDSPNPNLSEALNNCIENFDQLVDEVVRHKDFHERSQLLRVLEECLGNMNSFLQNENLTVDDISTGACALLNETAEKLKQMFSSSGISGRKESSEGTNKDLIKFGELEIRGDEEEDDDDESYVEGEEEDSSDEDLDDEDQEGESSIEPRLSETFKKSEARESLSSKEAPVKDLVIYQKFRDEHEDLEESENEPRMSDEAEKLVEDKIIEESDEDSFDIIGRDEELDDDSNGKEEEELELDVTQEDSEDDEQFFSL